MKMFLFQIGAIKREWCICHVEPLNMFLFQIGAIKSPVNVSYTTELRQVSIPNWCD